MGEWAGENPHLYESRSIYASQFFLENYIVRCMYALVYHTLTPRWCSLKSEILNFAARDLSLFGVTSYCYVLDSFKLYQLGVN